MTKAATKPVSMRMTINDPDTVHPVSPIQFNGFVQWNQDVVDEVDSDDEDEVEIKCAFLCVIKLESIFAKRRSTQDTFFAIPSVEFWARRKTVTEFRRSQ